MNIEYMLIIDDRLELPIGSDISLTRLYNKLIKNRVLDCTLSNLKRSLYNDVPLVLFNGQRAKIIKVEF